MSRELKFRVWDNEDQRMITAEQDFIPLLVCHKGVLKLDPCLPENRYMLFSKERFSVMQFTGLKDKNGKEIYEGDIRREEIEHGYGDERLYFVCVWIKELAKFAWLSPEEKFDYETLLDLSEFLNEDLGMDYRDNNKVVVVGNIFRNPELLKCR